MATIVPLTRYLGAEMNDVDLAKLIEARQVDSVNSLLDENGVVVIRDQKLSIDEFIAFSKLIGPLAIHPLQQFSKPGFPELMVNSNIVENGKPVGLADGGQHWHTDGAYLGTPHRATILYALEVPVKEGMPLGDTMFASTTAAYDALSDGMKKRLLPLRAVNYPNLARERSGKSLLDESQRERFGKGAEHPVVRTHPRTGKKCVYVNGNMTLRISGVDESESQALLASLFSHVTRPEFVYRHRWRVGDVVLWDNCSTQHCAVGDYQLPMRRLLYRTVVKGDVPA